METPDKCCTLVPYFKIHEGKLEEMKVLCEKFVELTRNEAKVLFYGFSFDGNQMHCREGYQDAEGILAHIENVGATPGSTEDRRPDAAGGPRSRE